VDKGYSNPTIHADLGKQLLETGTNHKLDVVLLGNFLCLGSEIRGSNSSHFTNGAMYRISDTIILLP
jgi:hypothetical protein